MKLDFEEGDILTTDGKKENEKEDIVPRLLAGAVLGDILKLHMRLNETCDKKANYILGISGLILIFMLTQFLQTFNSTFTYDISVKIGFIITILLTLTSAILSVFVIKPTIENADRLNLFYYGSFCNMITKE